MVGSLNPDGSELLRWEASRLVDSRGLEVSFPRFAVIGHPVGHSLSPRMHAAALQALGQSGEYRAIEVHPDGLETFLQAAFRSELEGLNITLPHKIAALGLATEADAIATSVAAANCLGRGMHGWVATNTDAPALAWILRRAAARHRLDWEDGHIILGGGGVARAAAWALLEVGAQPKAGAILVRDPAKVDWATGWRVAKLEDTAVESAGCILQCTPVGMADPEASVVDPARLRNGALLVDTIYRAGDASRLVREFRNASPDSHPVEGLTMLLLQGALSFAWWTGEELPLAAMSESLGLDPHSFD